MMSFQRWINISYLVVSALLWLVFRHLAEMVWDMAHLPAGSADAILAPADWVALVPAIVVLVVLLRHRRLNEFMGEVSQELAKVSWPPRKESMMSAGIIAVLVGVISLVLVGFDTLWQKLVGYIVFKT